jgi:hypothetical protein
MERRHQGFGGGVLFFVYFGLLILSLPAALVLLTLFAVSRSKVCLLAGLLWLLPVPYEVLVQSTCTGECNIRIDLLLVLPLELIGLGRVSRSAVTAFSEFRRARTGAAGGS